RFKSHAAIADWATNDEYTQKETALSTRGGGRPKLAAKGPLLRPAAQVGVPAPPRQAASRRRPEARAAGGPRRVRLTACRPRDRGPAEGGAGAARTGRGARPRCGLRPDRDRPRPAVAGGAVLGGGRQPAGGRADAGQ